MKKLLLLLMLIPLVTFSQVSSWRSNPPQPQRSTPSIQPSTPQRNDVSDWRSQPPSRGYDRPIRTRPGSNIIVRDPWFSGGFGWGWNRWDMWGAPAFGWNFWQPSWYWNDWGYRQPQRIYVYENGKRDTIRGKKPVINFSIHKTTNNQIGTSFAIGGKSYFIMDFVTTYESDRSTFFPYGNITQVDFPLINDLIKEKTIYFGGGRRFKRTGIHAMVGFGNEIVRWRGKDAIGEITFPKYNSNFTTIKIGAMRDIKNFTIKMDVDPIRNYGQLGLGLNF